MGYEEVFPVWNGPVSLMFIPDFDTALSIWSKYVGTILEIARAELFQPRSIIWNPL